jgi:anaerobic magnesium-protoporphyrin IX monomethyl ester cyclase
MTAGMPIPTDEIVLINAADTASELFNAATEPYEVNAFPNLGLLTLGTALRHELKARGLAHQVTYFDASVTRNERLLAYLEAHSQRLFAICFSIYTANYVASTRIAERVKQLKPDVIAVVGNDGFSSIWQSVMQRRSVYDYGFYGNDVVEGFSRLIADLAERRAEDPRRYPGLVYRDPADRSRILMTPEDPDEFHRLPLVDYSLTRAPVDHDALYFAEQRRSMPLLSARGARAVTIEFARGCLKFAGKRNDYGVPLNACDFCAINPGSKAMIGADAERAWNIIRNAVEQGYNYFFVTTDELPLTFWPLLSRMADRVPEWYSDMHADDRPRFLCYARADAFKANKLHRIDLMMNQLNYDTFWIGLEAFSTISLRAMNKGISASRNGSQDMFEHNMEAVEQAARRGARIGAGLIVTHLGITPEIMEANFQILDDCLQRYAGTFMEITVNFLYPNPGSLAFDYLRTPASAREAAAKLGLEVDYEYLLSARGKYADEDMIDTDELLHDFVRGCCPAITMEQALDYRRRVMDLISDHGVALV